MIPTLSVAFAEIATLELRRTVAPFFGEVMVTTGLMTSATGVGVGVGEGVGVGDGVGVGVGTTVPGHFKDTSVDQYEGIVSHGFDITSSVT